MSDAQQFTLPDLGEGLSEAEIGTWHVKVGDQVSLNEIIVDVETAKSVVELPSPYVGVVVEIHAKEGDVVPVGGSLVSIAAISEPDPSRMAPNTQLTATAEAPPVRTNDDLPPRQPPGPLVLVGTGPREADGRRIHLTRPTAPSERGTRESIRAAQHSEDPGTEVRIAVRGVRKATAASMMRSVTTAPQASMWTSVDITDSMRLLRQLKGDPDWAGVRVTPLVLMARTVALAVRDNPEINASFDDAAQEIVRKSRLNLGIAVASPRGLVVPNIKDAGALSMRELAVAMQEMVAVARAGTLSSSDMSGGTLTLTNVGSFGVEGATPILNPPEAAIVALGAIEDRPWVVDGKVVVREVMTLSITVDHRLVDGELGARVLRQVAALLTDPARALL